MDVSLFYTQRKDSLLFRMKLKRKISLYLKLLMFLFCFASSIILITISCTPEIVMNDETKHNICFKSDMYLTDKDKVKSA
jgi:hypothetical protein